MKERRKEEKKKEYNFGNGLLTSLPPIKGTRKEGIMTAVPKAKM